MKKIAKVWVLCLTLATLLAALYTSAVVVDTKQVTLILLEWSNTCMLNDYTFPELQASPRDQLTQEMTGSITCTFLENSADIVTLVMSDLSSNMNISIPASGFHAQISSGVVQWSIWNLQDGFYSSLSSSQQIYSKEINTIWVWTGTLTLQWTIPGWTPGWIYTGSLELTLQHGVPQNSWASQGGGN